MCENTADKLGVVQALPYLAKRAAAAAAAAAVINVAQCATVYFGRTDTERVSVNPGLPSGC